MPFLVVCPWIVFCPPPHLIFTFSAAPLVGPFSTKLFVTCKYALYGLINIGCKFKLHLNIVNITHNHMTISRVFLMNPTRVSLFVSLYKFIKKAVLSQPLSIRFEICLHRIDLSFVFNLSSPITQVTPFNRTFSNSHRSIHLIQPYQ